MTHYKLLLLLVSFFCITSLYAQKRNFLMYKDSVLGKDTLLLSEISDKISYPNPSIILKIQFFIL